MTPAPWFILFLNHLHSPSLYPGSGYIQNSDSLPATLADIGHAEIHRADVAED
jgi:hypothetical protein